MFEKMTEQQAREQILEMTKAYCEKYHNLMKKGTGFPMLPGFTVLRKW